MVNSLLYGLFQISAEMEYCVSATSMLVEEIWQIVKGFVEVPANMLAQLMKCTVLSINRNQYRRSLLSINLYSIRNYLLQMCFVDL